MTTQVKRIGDALLEANLMTREQMETALQKQVVTNERLGELLIRLGVVSEYDLAILLAEQRGVEYADMFALGAPEKDVLELFNQEFCIHRAFLPIKREGNALVVVIGNADASEVEQAVTRRVGFPCIILQGEFSKVLQSIRHNFYFINNPVDSLFAKEIKRLEKDHDEVLAPDALINHLLHFAVRERASDIHIQPEEKSIHLSFRIDGVMLPMIALSHQLRRLIATIKMQSGMDISDNLRPQDGSFSVTIIDTNYDIRVSTLITEHGENVVMRLLPSGEQVLGLNQLDFYPEDVIQLEQLFDNPYGILLMTGPTGSGKSTTLHAGVRTRGMAGKNILTVEDPIEYKLPIICQTEVNRKAGYTFASAIRQFLRHDPDVMLVGEIRDPETASAAITAAETGHLVLSTLHVNSVLGVIPRFQSLNIPAQMVADSLIGVVNQRLSRRICPHCRESHVPTEHELEYFPNGDITELFSGRGCKVCRHTGYLGRVPIYEILAVDKVLAELIAEGASRSNLIQEMMGSGFVPIETIALRRVRDGIITIQEAERLLGNSLKGIAK
jgi:type II secretory ATPase GspE/PulE/Tfp pilus assembly ATPase PilB-like protein